MYPWLTNLLKWLKNPFKKGGVPTSVAVPETPKRAESTIPPLLGTERPQLPDIIKTRRNARLARLKAIPNPPAWVQFEIEELERVD